MLSMMRASESLSTVWARWKEAIWTSRLARCLLETVVSCPCVWFALHVAQSMVAQSVEQALEMVDGAQGSAHERLDAGRIAIGEIFLPLDARPEALGQPVAGIRGRVEIEEAVELRLERANVIGEALGLLHELPQERHVLRDAPGDGNVVQGRQFKIWFASMQDGWIVVRTDSMAVSDGILSRGWPRPPPQVGHWTTGVHRHDKTAG